MNKVLLTTAKVLLVILGMAIAVSVAPAPVLAKDLIKTMQQDLGARRPKGCPHKWCACYMDIALVKAGYKPFGSNRARDFAKYGKDAKPMAVGSIMVMRNHIGVVAGMCDDGRSVKIISGNYSRKVSVGCYSPKKAIAWRAPIKG